MSVRLDADVVVIGSGFGGSVAALRFAEAGHDVLVLERGGRVTRETVEADLDWFWKPERGRFGPNELRRRGRAIVPWVGAAVGGGSHVYAGTLLRRDDFTGFPAAIRDADMAAYYERAEALLRPAPYPDYPPYDRARATDLLLEAGEALAASDAGVEGHGRVPLGISFAPPGTAPGTAFVNAHGSEQRYFDPSEQALLGGDVGAKNSLDHNYLFLAERAGARIRPMCEVDRIEPLAAGGYRVSGIEHRAERSRWRRLSRRWSPWGRRVEGEPFEVSARRVVVAAGAIGSTELLLRNRDVHRTLPALGDATGTRYSTNGDYMSLMIPFRWIGVSWLGFAAALAGLVLGHELIALAGAVAYGLGIVWSRRPYDPDVGTTNSDYVQFRGRRGERQGVYVESGRYPTPGRLGVAVVMSIFGAYRPHRYRWIARATGWLRRWVPPFALFARSWPIPLLQMGRDDAVGTVGLDAAGRARVDFDSAGNAAYYAYLDDLARRVARAARSRWIPNLGYRLTGILEVPHNQGGLPMGESRDQGVVDHAGRVYGHDDLMVLDGSIMPVAIGPNPALTITAVCERAMDEILAQLERGETVSASTND